MLELTTIFDSNLKKNEKRLEPKLGPRPNLSFEKGPTLALHAIFPKSRLASSIKKDISLILYGI